MATYKTTHIEVGDILAARIACGKCKAVLSVPISPNANFSRLTSCPNCDAPWLAVAAGPSIVNDVQKCAGAIKHLMEQLKQWEIVLKGRGSEIFSLTFEVSAPASGDHEA